MSRKRYIQICGLAIILLIFISIFAKIVSQNNRSIKINDFQLMDDPINIYSNIFEIIDERWGLTEDARILDEILYLDEENIIDMGYIRILDYQLKKIYSINIVRQEGGIGTVCVYAETPRDNDYELFADRITLEKNKEIIMCFVEQRERRSTCDACIFKYYNVSNIFSLDDVSDFIIADEDGGKDVFYMCTEYSLGTDMKLHYLISAD